MIFTQLVEYLKEPEAVIKLQKVFGIDYSNEAHSINVNPTKDFQKSKSWGKQTTNRSREIPGVLAHDETSKADINFGTKYRISQRFWYYTFLFGTQLGDELFYATFIPFWFWNVDSAVGRRFVLIWALVMYVGQSGKEIVRWPRPGDPVIRLQNKWALEYGMPSTHAMIAVCIPFSILRFTFQRYNYSLSVGITLALVWCSLVCVSRIYLGMHYVLDVIVGIIVAACLTVFLIPLVDSVDILILRSIISPFVVAFISIILIVHHPTSDKWTQTRGDTTMTISVVVGIQLAAWLNFQLGYCTMPKQNLSLNLVLSTYPPLISLCLRTLLGMCGIFAMRKIAKFTSFKLFCRIVGQDFKELKNSENSLKNKSKITVELCHIYVTYALIGFSIQFLLPFVFSILHIGRTDFYTEM